MAKQVEPSVRKLAMKLDDADLAEKLVKAGYKNPAQIRKASDGELEAVPGVGKASREKVRRKFPKQG